MKLKPSEKQLRFLDWEMGVFFHFGIRSFFMGHKDWDGQPMPAEAFCPDRLDCEQWVRTAKEAGAAYTILVCKHHDGFANWPSRYSDYSVAQTPWKGGKGDVVREYVNACRKYDMKVGLYYSPAQWQGNVSFTDDKAYDDYFINQISELLTNYGKIDYLWFDGCGSEKHEYDKPRIVQAIRSLQPDILIFDMWDPDTRWVGNEDGYAPLNNEYVVDHVPFSMLQTNDEALDESKFLPAECDCKLRSTWFDCEHNENTIKQRDELIGMYEMSVGRGANFLLNIGPNCHGRINDADVARLREFRAELDRRYAHPLPFGALHAADGETDVLVSATPNWTDDFGDSACNHLVDTVVLEEDITEGQSVRGFRIWASLPAYKQKRVCLYRGETIGHKAICHFSTVSTGRLFVEILDHEDEYKIKSLRAYRTRG